MFNKDYHEHLNQVALKKVLPEKIINQESISMGNFGTGIISNIMDKSKRLNRNDYLIGFPEGISAHGRWYGADFYLQQTIDGVLILKTFGGPTYGSRAVAHVSNAGVFTLFTCDISKPYRDLLFRLASGYGNIANWRDATNHPVYPERAVINGKEIGLYPGMQFVRRNKQTLVPLAVKPDLYIKTDRKKSSRVRHFLQGTMQLVTAKSLLLSKVPISQREEMIRAEIKRLGLNNIPSMILQHYDPFNVIGVSSWSQKHYHIRLPGEAKQGYQFQHLSNTFNKVYWDLRNNPQAQFLPLLFSHRGLNINSERLRTACLAAEGAFVLTERK